MNVPVDRSKSSAFLNELLMKAIKDRLHKVLDYLILNEGRDLLNNPISQRNHVTIKAGSRGGKCFSILLKVSNK